jgi:hypothetical protein
MTDETIVIWLRYDILVLSMSEALDRIDRHVVALLQAAGRSSYQELGDAVGLSAPATYQLPGAG